jgi:putative lipoic acid-binding regulatory protein
VDQDDDLFRFPCDFPVKAIGQRHPDLDAIVFGIVRPHAPDVGEAAVRIRESTGGKYASVTVIIRATSRAQLDAIYRDLTASEHILLVL